jgi:hypothetical protein
VLAQPTSPYRLLGREIAALESVPLVDSVAAALVLRPEFLLWVVSPTELSDDVATSFNLALDRASSRPSTGLITGSTIGHARDLYARAMEARGGRAAIVLGEDAFTPTPRLVEIAGDQQHSRPLTSAADVFDLLKRFDYVHYAGHGGGGYWRPLRDERITASSISRVGPVVISTMSCQTTRIWEPGSIGLRMVDQGAAAYSGFYYSPIAGYQIGEEDGPFRHTWPDVPIGHAVAAMNEGARKGYARFPFDLILGDPRLALHSDAPCLLEDEGELDDARTFSCVNAPAGLLPLRIPDGARYGFVEVAGGTSAWDRQPFFNRRVQMATIGEDRILLVEHPGGDLHFALRERPPVIWLATHSIVDSLDKWLVGMADQRHGGDAASLLLATVAVPLTVRRLRRRKHDRMHVLPAAGIGVVAAVLHASYGLFRQGALVVIAKPIVFSPLAALGTGLLVACGALVFLSSASWRGRLWGTVVATSVGWVGGTVAFAMTATLNIQIASATGVGGWIYNVDLSPFVVSAVGCVVCALIFSMAGHAHSRFRRTDVLRL